MRMLMTARMDSRSSTEVIADGTMPKLLESAMAQLKPEAAYFTAVDGDRTCFIVFDMKETTEMPVVSEKFFNIGAKVTLQPVMNADDLRAGLKNLRS